MFDTEEAFTGVTVDKRGSSLLFWDVSPREQARGKHGEMRTLWLKMLCGELRFSGYQSNMVLVVTPFPYSGDTNFI